MLEINETVSDQVDGISDTEADPAKREDSKATIIDPADHHRAVEDMKKFKGLTKQLQDEINNLKGALKKTQTATLQEKEDYKLLWEQANSELQEKEGKLSELKDSVFYNARHQAVLDGLRKAGLRPEAERILDHYDLSEIEVEVTNKGRFQVGSVSSLINRIKQEYSFAFESKKMPRVNPKGGSSVLDEGEPLTAAKVAEIELQCKKKGDMKPYYDAVALFNKQRKQGAS